MNIIKNIALIPKVLATYKNPQVFFLDKLKLYGKKLIAVRLRNGLTFSINSANSDINSVTEIFIFHGYDKFFGAIMPGAVVVDIGANIGLVSVAAGKLRANVFSFEPNPVVLPMLKENIRLNGLESRVSVFPMAVAGKPGMRTMYFEEAHWGGASLIPEIGREAKDKVHTYEIKCVDMEGVFAAINAPKIDVLKVDCEGGEGEIFAAMSKEQFNRIDAILLEYHEPHVSKESLAKLLRDNGFIVEQIPDFPAFWAYKQAL